MKRLDVRIPISREEILIAQRDKYITTRLDLEYIQVFRKALPIIDAASNSSLIIYILDMMIVENRDYFISDKIFRNNYNKFCIEVLNRKVVSRPTYYRLLQELVDLDAVARAEKKKYYINPAIAFNRPKAQRIEAAKNYVYIKRKSIKS